MLHIIFFVGCLSEYKSKISWMLFGCNSTSHFIPCLMPHIMSREHGWDAPASIWPTFTNKPTQFFMSENLRCNFSLQMINLLSNFGRVMAASNMAALLMKGCALFDNLFSLVYPSPMLIPLAVADSEAQWIGNISVWCQAMQSNWTFKPSLCALKGPWRSGLCSGKYTTDWWWYQWRCARKSRLPLVCS